MPRYHFNVFDGQSWPDARGTRLGSMRQARLEAVHLAGAMLQQHAERVCLSADWRMEVTDDAGLILFRLAFSLVEAPETGKPH